jgi:undecaprenyl-diphosphatase
MDWMQAVVLGIVEGLTEFLPISSTAHLMLTSRLLGLPEPPSDFVKTFEIVIQPGAVLAVVLLYWHRFFVEWRVLLRVVVAFVPTGAIGLAVYPIVKGYLLDSISISLAALAIGGFILIVFELWHRDRPETVSILAKVPFWKCVVIGICQALAVIPGVSRSAATIVSGLALGLSRKAAVEFSFLLAVPTLAAASCLELWHQWWRSDSIPVEHIHLLLIGFVVSFVAAILTVQLFLRFIRTHLFIGFGVYRIVLAAVFWLVLVNH